MSHTSDQSEKRPEWDSYFLEIARLVATRATCLRAAVGAVLVRDKRILTTGYNGAPPGQAHCLDVGCLMIEGHCLRTTHAEANAVVQAAQHGVKLEGATLYCTHSPCLSCTKLLISAGVKQVHFLNDYADLNARSMFKEAGVAFKHYKPIR